MKTFKEILSLIVMCISLCISSVFGSSLSAACPTDVTLSSQADVDSFSLSYAGCFIIGTLPISGSDIVNLDGLSSLTGVGFLTIENNSSLINLSGLSKLAFVGSGEGGQSPISGFTLNNNAVLVDVLGLSSLYRIDRSFLIYNNPRLRDLLRMEFISMSYEPMTTVPSFAEN